MPEYAASTAAWQMISRSWILLNWRRMSRTMPVSISSDRVFTPEFKYFFSVHIVKKQISIPGFPLKSLIAFTADPHWVFTILNATSP